MNKTIPFTLPHDLIQAVNEALKAYPARYALLENRMEQVKNSSFAPLLLGNTYPVIATITHEKMDKIVETCALNGLLLHSASDYLKQKNHAQISTIQPSFEEDFKKLNVLFSYLTDTL